VEREDLVESFFKNNGDGNLQDFLLCHKMKLEIYKFLFQTGKKRAVQLGDMSVSDTSLNAEHRILYKHPILMRSVLYLVERADFSQDDVALIVDEGRAMVLGALSEARKLTLKNRGQQNIEETRRNFVIT